MAHRDVIWNQIVTGSWWDNKAKRNEPQSRKERQTIESDSSVGSTSQQQLSIVVVDERIDSDWSRRQRQMLLSILTHHSQWLQNSNALCACKTSVTYSHKFSFRIEACRGSHGQDMTAHTHTFNGLFPGLPRWAGTRKVKPIWILLKQETVSGSAISWAICKSASRSRQITMPVPHHSKFFYRPDALPATQPTASKHWRIWQHRLP